MQLRKLSSVREVLILSLTLGCVGSDGAKQQDAAAPAPPDASAIDAKTVEVNVADAARPDSNWHGVGPACNTVPTSGDAGGEDAGGSMDGGLMGEEGTLWDWVGMVGTGQSLAVGDHGMPIKSTTQPYRNLKLSTGTLAWPVDPNAPDLAMVPLTEPVGRLAHDYPSAWPENIAGETMHSSMGNQITSQTRAATSHDFVNVHGEFGENGQCMKYLRKGATPSGVNGRAFQATLIETQAITRLAAGAGKTYGVGAITIVHGECDSVNPTYEDDLVKLWTDYNTDLRAITGQAQSIPMLVSQQNSTNNHSDSTLAQWKVGVDHPGDFVCVGPKYQYPAATDGTHLTVDGYRQLGEKFGQVFFERMVLGHDWRPLQPTSIERKGRVISVHFHVPVLPLAWDAELQPPHQNSEVEWALGKGFEVRAGTKGLLISSADIVCSTGDTVEITMAEDLPATEVIVTYAIYGEASARSIPVTGTARWGLLRDSDPFVGSSTQQAQPNYAVAFELPVPDL